MWGLAVSLVYTLSSRPARTIWHPISKQNKGGEWLQKTTDANLLPPHTGIHMNEHTHTHTHMDISTFIRFTVIYKQRIFKSGISTASVSDSLFKHYINSYLYKVKYDICKTQIIIFLHMCSVCWSCFVLYHTLYNLFLLRAHSSYTPSILIILQLPSHLFCKILPWLLQTEGTLLLPECTQQVLWQLNWHYLSDVAFIVLWSCQLSLFLWLIFPDRLPS